MELGSTPALTRLTTDSIKVVVLPVPGPPKITKGEPRCAITDCWAEEKEKVGSDDIRRTNLNFFETFLVPAADAMTLSNP